jgi:hypothetical protein
MDVVREHQEVHLENQQNLHQKMQVEQPFIKFSPVEALLKLSDPFASLTIAEMVYLGMDTPSTSSSHARHKRASTTVPDSDDEIEQEDMVTMVTTTMRTRTMSGSCYYSFLFPFWCLDAKGAEVVIVYLSCVIVNNVKF